MSPIRKLWDWLCPPGLSKEQVNALVRALDDVATESHRLAETLEKVIETARADKTSPFAVLIRQTDAVSMNSAMTPKKDTND